MDQETKTILSVARAFKNYVESEGGKKTLNNLKYLTENDHLVKVLFSKLQNGNQRIKTIFATYFMLLRTDIKPEVIVKIINNLYKYEIEIYDETRRKEVECGYCGGGGEERCDSCDGDGKIECRYCDGTGKEGCYDCDGSGAETCGECDGDGKVEEYDDEGEDVEVQCDECAGSGKVNCTTCDGESEISCGSCEGDGEEECRECGGYGQTECENCYGSGTEETNEEYFEIGYMTIVVVGSGIMKFENTKMTLEEYEELNANDKIFSYELTVTNFSDMDDIDEEDRYKMEDFDEPFVKFRDVYKV
jgi:predicted transcriptional regulator